MKKENGITLMALVITIIVLLILASISINMINGNNSIINHAANAKELSEIAGLEEQLNMTYIKNLGKTKYGEDEKEIYRETVEALQEQGYNIEKIAKGRLLNLKLDNDKIYLGTADTTKTEYVEVINESDQDKYYYVVSGKYFEITLEDDEIQISKKASKVNIKSDSDEYNIQVSTGDETIATATVDGTTITITGKKKAGETDLIVTAEGITLTGKITTVTGLATKELDGAMFLKTDFAENETVAVEDTRFVTVTQDKAIKCTNKMGKTVATITAEDGTETKYKINSTAKIVYTPTSNSTVNGGEKGPYNPTVPVGFSAIDTKDAKWNLNGEQTDVNKGLVIMDNEGNQFVWIPVPTVVAESEEAGTENKAMAVQLANGNYRGLLYNFSKAENGTLSSSVKVGCTTTTSSNREPDTINSYDGNAGNLNIIKQILTSQTEEYKNRDTFKNTMQRDYNDMITSVLNYGGFYIGRYESSLLNNTTRVIMGRTSMNGENPTSNDWWGLYARQKDYGLNMESVKSSMIWGSQYDAMTNWMMNQGIDVTSSNPNGGSRNSGRITGGQIKDKMSNVFDLLGNSIEYSMEAIYTYHRISRGGDFEGRWSCTHESVRYEPIGTVAHIGSRPTLYIIEN